VTQVVDWKVRNVGFGESRSPRPFDTSNWFTRIARARKRIREAFADEPELADVVKAVLDLDLSKPQEIAETLGISTDEVQNRKKRLRRRLVEYGLVTGRGK
jgi:hypothetical protein